MTRDALIVASDVVAWIAISVVWGTIGALLPKRFLNHDSWWTRPRAFERGGAWYRRIGIRRWKDALPESNRLGPGQRMSKRRLPRRDRYGAFVAETRRAEYVHLAIALSGVVFALWNPPWLAAVMVIFGWLFNLPFIAIQRYNRARLQRVTRRASP